MQYYLQLIGEEISRLPNSESEFSDLPNNIEKPVDVSGLKLIRYEKEQMDRAKDSADVQIGVGVVESLASVLSLVPEGGADLMFWGIGIDVKFGGRELSAASSAIARMMRIVADHLAYQSSSAATKTGFLRALQERIHQANQAGHDIKNIDKTDTCSKHSRQCRRARTEKPRETNRKRPGSRNLS